MSSKVGISQLASTKTDATTDATTTRPIISSITRPPRLPVWPVFPGLLLSLLDLLKFPVSLSARLEDSTFGGRVSPMSFPKEQNTSPFIMLVHHRHRFESWNVIVRKATELLLPEGFPAHPHRGFETLTICLKGGMTHRDSMGVKQRYGRGVESWVQWLKAGRGVLHEEFWATGLSVDQELYQIWIDSPKSLKMCEPDLKLLGDGRGIEATSKGEGCEEVVIQRPWNDGGSETSVRIIKLKRSSTQDGIYHASIPPSHSTVILYVKSGSGGGSNGVSINSSSFVPVHSYAILQPGVVEFTVSLEKDGKGEAEILLLTGRPLGHNVVAAGSFVMNSEAEIQQANIDYSKGEMGRPWDHKISDEEWRREVADHWEKMERRN
ncbi:hypothetical protein TrST_g5701 [Triparma strigata]|uniref:Pirin n=1 Tax=Triparma strigata TaxID=1606541 RepID=A0A9W7EI07_9STRA|nr:hypothetical protein TrST_g5701 [Triparma strigata]